MSKDITKRRPEWHGEAITLLKENGMAITTAFLDATRRAAWYGLFLNYVKLRGKQDKSIPHGQFRPWLKANLPDLSLSQAAFYMTLGRNLAEKAQVQISGDRTFATAVNAGQIPEAVEKLIAGKTQNALFLEYKQSELPEGDDLYLTPKRGRRKGEGGATAAQRAAHASKIETKELLEIVTWCENTRDMLDEVTDDQRLGRLHEVEGGELARKNLLQSMEHAVAFLRRKPVKA